MFGMGMDLLLSRVILMLEMLKNGALGEKEWVERYVFEEHFVILRLKLYRIISRWFGFILNRGKIKQCFWYDNHWS